MKLGSTLQGFLKNGNRESRSRPEHSTKNTGKPALKVAGEDPIPVYPEMAIELGTNQASAHINGSLLTADEAHDTGDSAKRPKEVMVQVLEKPYTTSYFLPGKLEGRPVQFLVDTGCTTNLLSKQVFDRLPERVRSCLEESDSHGIMADGGTVAFLQDIDTATPSKGRKD